jgi:hypothetical protein
MQAILCETNGIPQSSANGAHQQSLNGYMRNANNSNQEIYTSPVGDYQANLQTFLTTFSLGMITFAPNVSEVQHLMGIVQAQLQYYQDAVSTYKCLLSYATSRNVNGAFCCS